MWLASPNVAYSDKNDNINNLKNDIRKVRQPKRRGRHLPWGKCFVTTGYLVIILNVLSHFFPGGLILNSSLLASMVWLGPSFGIIDKIRLKKLTASSQF